MAFEKFPPTNASEAVAVFKQDVIIVHDVAHGDENSEVLTENGLIPSVAKFMKDTEQRIGDGVAGLDHQVLGNRTQPDCHSIGAITNLQTELDAKAPIVYVDGEVATLETSIDAKADKFVVWSRLTSNSALGFTSKNLVDGTGLTMTIADGTVDGQECVFSWKYGSSFSLTGNFSTHLGDDTELTVTSTDVAVVYTLIWDATDMKWGV